ncbi:hypothetical protein Tco_1566023, partial [Tanacetum coccineum]
AAESVRDVIGFEYCLASSIEWTKGTYESNFGGYNEGMCVALEGRNAFWKEGLRLSEELNSIHDTFHLSNLKKCLGNSNLHVPLNEIKIDKTLHFVEEPVEILDRKIRSLKSGRISLVKAHWNSKRGLEFTWEREDHMKSKYPQLFVDRAVELAI